MYSRDNQEKFASQKISDFVIINDQEVQIFCTELHKFLPRVAEFPPRKKMSEFNIEDAANGFGGNILYLFSIDDQ